MESEDLVRQALKSVRRMGLRRAGDTLGVSHETVRRWRAWDDGAGELPAISPETRVRLEDYLGAAPVEESPSYADGVRYAMAKMEEVLQELRELLHESGEGEADVSAVEDAFPERRGPGRRAGGDGTG